VRLLRLLTTPLLLLLLGASPALADVTGFVGLTTTPSSRPVSGLALGAGLLIVGFEFEYAHTRSEADEAAPSLNTYMGNVLLQTPFPIAGMQFYFTTGAGGYRESLESVHQETNVGLNTGGGAKISLFGPLRARVDYRVFRLKGDPLHDTVHRLYAGVNVGF
jgi:hypothetical protein